MAFDVNMRTERTMPTSVVSAVNDRQQAPEGHKIVDKPNTLADAKMQGKTSNADDLQSLVAKQQAQQQTQQQELASKEVKPYDQRLEDALSTLREFVDSNHRGLEFAIDKSAGKTVIKVLDRANDDKVIRQIPSDEALQLASKIKEIKEEVTNKTGILFDLKA